MQKFDSVQIRKYIDGLLFWQKLMVLAISVGSLFVVWLVLVFLPFNASLNRMQTKLETHEKVIAAYQEQLTNGGEIEGKGGDKKAVSGAAIAPKQPVVAVKEVANLIANILEQQHDLVLIDLEDMRVVANGHNKNMHKHLMRLKFKGDYFATLRYLKVLEDLRWPIYWEKLDYKVLTYPEAEISLEFAVYHKEADE